MTSTSGTREYGVECVECTATHRLPSYQCRRCSGPLVLRMDPARPDDVKARPGAAGLWRHGGLLPRTQHAVTLGEGATPLLRLPWLGGDGSMVYAKLESLNPTLSFKDRAMALGASVALDLGLPGLVLASTGNAAVSAAAYAAAAGLECRVYCATASAAGTKLAIAAAHGAEIHTVDGDYSDAYQRAAESEGEGWFNVTTTYRNPLLATAYRGLAAELVADLGQAPDTIVVPVGAGPLLAGLRWGFDDLLVAGVIGGLPQLVGVQAAACAPLARAWDAADWSSSLATPPVAMPTVAGAIADSLRGYEREGMITLAAARDSGGLITAVAEENIIAATHEFFAHGVAAEPAAAASITVVREQRATPGVTVMIVTGHAAKEPPGVT